MKALKILLIMTMLVSALVGCEKERVETPEIPDLPKDNVAVEETVIKAKLGIPAKIQAFTEITSYVGDVDSDETNERVFLATSAERDENGSFLWNDGQNWALCIEDTEGFWVLFDEYVQAGNVYFEVSDYYMAEETTVPKITVTMTTGAGFQVRTYTFSEEKGGYVEEIVYDTAAVTEAGVNRRFTSFPEIVG